MSHYRDGFYQRNNEGKIEVWFYVKGVSEYKPPDRTIRITGFPEGHFGMAQKMIDDYCKQTTHQEEETMELSEARLKMGGAILVVLNDLKLSVASGEARDSNTPLNNVMGKLSEALSSIREDNDHCVVAAKEACEMLVDRVSRAVENGGMELANVLRGHVNALSPLVAVLYSRHDGPSADA